MSLFVVNRFTTDDDDVCAPTEQRSKSLLEKLKQRAQLKKQQIDATKQQLKDESVESTQEREQLLQQRLSHTERTVDDNNDLQSKTKGRNKRTLSGNVTVEESSVDAGDSKSSRKKKRKKDSPEVGQPFPHKYSHHGVDVLPVTSDSSPLPVSTSVGEELSDDEAGEEETSDGEEGVGSEVKDCGFTIIGSDKKKGLEKVDRVLPHWLSHPTIIETDVRDKRTPVDDLTCLSSVLKGTLKENGITHFFPVQRHLIPVLMNFVMTGVLTGRAGYRPSDICCSAPTGSGKTLAFVLPIIQALQGRVVCGVRALVVLPVRDLACQVYNVFRTYCNGTSLKVALITGQKTLSLEQKSLLRKGVRGYHSTADIIVATPGRLVDHITMTTGFSLQQLRFLVIDEADRMMDEIKQDWLTQVENAVFACRQPPGALNVASVSKMHMPLQKLLFSATLSQNPEKLDQLNLFQPKLFTSVVSEQHSMGAGSGQVAIDEKIPISTEGEFVGKYTTPKGLTEFFVECSSSEKPLTVLYFLHQLKFRNVLCFTKSVEATHRLFLLLKVFGGLEVREFSSGLHAMARGRILKQFASGKIDVIVCSDAMARGMDIDNVKYVISYDHAPYIKTYIHRVGRTARAGRVGTAVTLLEKKEIRFFKDMMKSAGKDKVSELTVRERDLAPLVEQFQEALCELPKLLKAEKSKK